MSLKTFGSMYGGDAIVWVILASSALLLDLEFARVKSHKNVYNMLFYIEDPLLSWLNSRNLLFELVLTI